MSGEQAESGKLAVDMPIVQTGQEMKRLSLPAVRAFSSSELIVIVSLFVALFSNTAFFRTASGIFSPDAGNILFLFSLFVFVTSVLVLALSAVCHKSIIKPILIAFLLIASFSASFMNQYGVVINHRMIGNAVETNLAEVRDLINLRLFLYFVFLGVLPSLFIYKARLAARSRRAAFASRAILVGAALAAIIAAYIPFSAQYASAIRMHRDLWYRINPTYPIYSAGKYVRKSFAAAALPHMIVGADAKIARPDKDRELVIMVVGETVRADHFSLNGNARETNPLLKREKVVNFTNFWSCATSTSQSVPCMFSPYMRRDFDSRNARATDNALDLLNRAGVSVLWRDNNSDSKGVAMRVKYEAFRTGETNPVCDSECRDVGMLPGLQAFIDKTDGDVMIVLHQMGNHGPAYYKRYPAAFEKFTPACKSSDLGACTYEEVVNSYDNAILYTDYFLSKVIELLKQNDEKYETAMIYVSDHGESLGENGVYLHGLPYFIAPDAQKRVPAVMWFGKKFDKESLIDIEKTRKKRLSHDNLFSTLLGLFEVRSSAYDPKMDILRRSAPEQW